MRIWAFYYLGWIVRLKRFSAKANLGVNPSQPAYYKGTKRVMDPNLDKILDGPLTDKQREELFAQLKRNSHLCSLLYMLYVQSGMLGDEYEFAEEGRVFKLRGNPDFGSRVKIKWKSEYEGFPGLVDYGYILHLPIDDFEMTEVVHVPRPSGGEKSQPEAEWIPLDRLLKFENLEYIQVLKGK